MHNCTYLKQFVQLSKYHLLKDGVKYKKPVHLPAPQYIALLMDWVSNTCLWVFHSYTPIFPGGDPDQR